MGKDLNKKFRANQVQMADTHGKDSILLKREQMRERRDAVSTSQVGGGQTGDAQLPFWSFCRPWSGLVKNWLH